MVIWEIPAYAVERVVYSLGKTTLAVGECIFSPIHRPKGVCDVILIRRFLGPWRQPAFPIWLLATLTSPWVGLDVAVPRDPKPCTRLLAESKNGIKPSVKRWLEAANHVIVLRHTEKGPKSKKASGLSLKTGCL